MSLFVYLLKNDFLDHFGISDKTGKGLDDDMKTGIIGWPVVYAWKYSSDEQRKLIAVSLFISFVVAIIKNSI